LTHVNSHGARTGSRAAEKECGESVLSKLRSEHAIDHAGWFKPGDTIVIMAVGAGMARGVGIIRW
jgi:hypothetical protein